MKWTGNDYAMLGFIVAMGLFCILIGVKLNQKDNLQARARAFNCYTIRGTAHDIRRTDSAMAQLHIPSCR